MDNIYTKDDLTGLLEATARQDPKAEKLLLQPVRGKTIYDYIIKEWPDKPKLSSEDLYSTISEGMNNYLKGYQAPPSFRQKLWETCRNLAGRIAEQAGYTPEYKFDTYVPQPVAEDTGISLIKELHDESGVTKKDLQKKLGVDERTVRYNLRALCPELGEGIKKQNPIRIGGQEIRATIKVAKDKHGEKKYSMPERLHPLIMQLNTYQVCNLLHALQVMNVTEQREVCLGIALDIWGQLSECGKQCIKEKGSELYTGFNDFANELSYIFEGETLPVFKTEEEMENLSRKEELELAFKSGEPHNFTLKQNGIREYYSNYIIKKTDSDTWLAVPASENSNQETPVAFYINEVYAFIERSNKQQ